MTSCRLVASNMSQGINLVLNASCSHSGTIQWIEQFLKKKKDCATVEELRKSKSKQPRGELQCHCDPGSLLEVPSIRKHFHVQGNRVCSIKCYQSALQKLQQVMEKNKPREVSELLNMLKTTKALSEAEEKAVGTNERELQRTIQQETKLLDTSAGKSLIRDANILCSHYGAIQWIEKYLQSHRGFVSIAALNRARDESCRGKASCCKCDVAYIFDDLGSKTMLPFRIRAERVTLLPVYESGLEKLKAFLKRKGPQPIGTLLDMLKHDKVLTAEEEKKLGTNKKELAKTISKEPTVFTVVSSPGVVMLKGSEYEYNNQVAKVVKYTEKFLRTCQKCSAQVVLEEVVKSLRVACVSGVNSLKKLLASYPKCFQISKDGAVSLTRKRWQELDDEPLKKVDRSLDHPYSPMVSSVEGRLGHSSYTGFEFVENLLVRKGPLTVQEIFTHVQTSTSLGKTARRAFGRTPDELLSELSFLRGTFKIIPPYDIVVLCRTNQLESNRRTTGLGKVQEYLQDRRPLVNLLSFVAAERKASGKDENGLNHTVAHMDQIQDVGGVISPPTKAEQSKKKRKRSHEAETELEACNPHKKVKAKKQKKDKKHKKHKKRKRSHEEQRESASCKPIKKLKTSCSSPPASNTVQVDVLQTVSQWISACLPLCKSQISSAVGIECDHEWLMLRQFDGKVIATRFCGDVLSAAAAPPPPPSSVETNQVTATSRTETSHSTESEPELTSQGSGGEGSAAHGEIEDILWNTMFLFRNSSVVKVMYDVQRILPALSKEIHLRTENIFDVKIADQLIRRQSPKHPLPDRLPLHELCEVYGVNPPTEVEVSCSPLPSSKHQAVPSQTVGVTTRDVARLENMAVRVSTLMPHLLQKLIGKMTVEMLTEHNCIVEEVLHASKKSSFPSRRQGPGLQHGPHQEHYIVPRTNITKQATQRVKDVVDPQASKIPVQQCGSLQHKMVPYSTRDPRSELTASRTAIPDQVSSLVKDVDPQVSQASVPQYGPLQQRVAPYSTNDQRFHLPYPRPFIPEEAAHQIKYVGDPQPNQAKRPWYGPKQQKIVPD